MVFSNDFKLFFFCIFLTDKGATATAHKMNGNVPHVDHHEEPKSVEESPTSDEKVKSEEKKEDTKDDGEKICDIKEDIVNPPESQPFSVTAESGATTAPTLPEDEHITLDEIKEDVVIEEKYIKEETKETQVIVTAATDEPGERVQPKPMLFEAQQPHLRELNIKTPDEVADLPMHEEADIGTVDLTPAGSRKASLLKDAAKPEPTKTETVEVKETELEKPEIDDKFDLDAGKKEEKPKSPTEVESKSPIDKKSPSPTSRKKSEDNLTKIEPKIASPVEKVEYKVEDLGQQFDKTLKDVTGKVEVSELKGKSPSPVEDVQAAQSISPKEEVLAADETIDHKSVSTVEVKQGEMSPVTKDSAEVEKEDDDNEKQDGTKSVSPTKDFAQPERKDSILKTSDMEHEIEEKGTSPKP